MKKTSLRSVAETVLFSVLGHFSLLYLISCCCYTASSWSCCSQTGSLIFQLTALYSRLFLSLILKPDLNLKTILWINENWTKCSNCSKNVFTLWSKTQTDPQKNQDTTTQTHFSSQLQGTCQAGKPPVDYVDWFLKLQHFCLYYVFVR